MSSRLPMLMRRLLDELPQSTTLLPDAPLRVTSTSSTSEERGAAGPQEQGGRSDRGGFRLFRVREVRAQPIPDPLIGGMYSLNSTGLLYAKAAVGKSVLLLDQMGHVSMG